MGKEVLLVIDMLNDFVLQGAPLEVPDARDIVPRVRDEIDKARSHGIPVIYLCDSHDKHDQEFKRMGWPPHALEGTRGAEIVSELRPLPGEPVIAKKSYSGFFRTSLEETLKKIGAADILVAGCVTNICVLYTVADAVQRGYRVKVIKSCIAGISAEDHEFGISQMQRVLGAEIV